MKKNKKISCALDNLENKTFAPHDLHDGWAESFISQLVLYDFGFEGELILVNDYPKFFYAPKEVFEYIAPDILEISIDIAKKIIKKEVESDPQVLIETIMDVLKTVSKNEPKINIRVKPQAAAFIKDTLPTETYRYGIDANINIISDPSVEDGGCIFQTNNGIVDASVDTQLEIIKKALMGI